MKIIHFIIDPPCRGTFFTLKCAPSNIIKTVLVSKPFTVLSFTPKLSALCLKMEGYKGFSLFVAPRPAADWQAITIK